MVKHFSTLLTQHLFLLRITHRARSSLFYLVSNFKKKDKITAFNNLTRKDVMSYYCRNNLVCNSTRSDVSSLNE